MRNLCAWPKDVSCLRLCSSKCLIKQMCHVCENQLCYSKIIVFKRSLCCTKSCYSRARTVLRSSAVIVPKNGLALSLCYFAIIWTSRVYSSPKSKMSLWQFCAWAALYATCFYFAPFCKWLSLFKMIARNPFIVSTNNAHNHCATWTECLLRQSTSFWFLLGFDEYHFQILSFPKIFHEKSIPILDRE